jgi:hypothetical protein
MLWLTLTEVDGIVVVAVIVAVYVPAGVPGVWDDELPPPHPTHDAKASTISGAASLGSRFRLRSNSQPEPSNSTVQVIGIAPGVKST